MSPSPPPPSPSAARMPRMSGRVIVLAVLIGPVLLSHGFQGPVMEWLGFHGGSPAGDALWQRITHDFARGICASAAMVFAIGAAVAARRWWPAYTALLFWLPVVWYGVPITRGWIIYQSCPGLLDGRRSTSRWPTLESYVNDAAIGWAQTLILGAPMVLLALSLIMPLSDLWLRHRGRRKAA